MSCSRAETALYHKLDDALKNKVYYENTFNGRVEVLRRVLAKQQTPQQQYEIIKSIANEFKSNSFDSTVHYLQRNKRLAELCASEEMTVESDLMLAEEYALAGYHIEASGVIGKYSYSSVPVSLRQLYFHVVHALAGEMLGYSKSDEVYQEMKARRDAARDSLLSILPPDSYEWLFLKQQEIVSGDQDSLKQEYCRKMLGKTTENSHEYAKASYFYAMSFPEEDPRRTEWLINSATADIMSGTKDYESLNKIARDLFARGSIGRSFRYEADHCMPDALYFNGKLRSWQIAQFFPLLEKAYEQEMARQRHMLWMLILLALGMLAVLAFLLMLIFRRQKALREVNRELMDLNSRIQEADKVKQEYIASFLSILSENISESRQYKNHVLKYIRRGNERFLAEEIESLPPIDEDIQNFYKMFDRTFANLYPNFLDKFNGLLADGEAIMPKDGDILTPELRVFALIKLGITDSSRIASLLHYSANTIYNYKAKIKKKARGDRDKFEEEVRCL